MNHNDSPSAICFDGFDLASGQGTLRSLSAVEAARFVLERPGAGLEMAPSKAPPGFPEAWAVVCPPGLDPGVLDALDPLVRHREGQLLP